MIVFYLKRIARGATAQQEMLYSISSHPSCDFYVVLEGAYMIDRIIVPSRIPA